MKQFKFKLQAVLDYRADQVDLARQEVAKEEQVRQGILKRLQEFDEVIAQAFVDQQQVLNQREVDIRQLQHFPNYILHLKQQRSDAFNQLQKQEEVLKVRRELLKQVLVKKRSLEVLKDKAKARYQNTLNKAEEAFLAEISQNMIARKTQAQRLTGKSA